MPHITYVVHFKAHNDKYVYVERMFWLEKLWADRDKAAAWETFDLIPLGIGPLKSGDVINLRADNDLYVYAVRGGGGELIARSNTPIHSAAFTILHADKSDGEIKNGDEVALRTFNGQYVGVKSNNELVAEKSQIGPSEIFIIEIVE